MLPSLSAERGDKKGQVPTKSWNYSIISMWKITVYINKKKKKTNPRIFNHFSIFVSVKKLQQYFIMITYHKELITALTIGTKFFKLDIEPYTFS